MKRIAVVTTFSGKGWKEYARRMVASFEKHWPAEVHLFCYPDVLLDDAVASPRVHYFYPKIELRAEFMASFKDDPKANGHHPEGTPYNYRFDAVKFCHKPFVLHHFACHYNVNRPTPFDAMIWLDADSLTHSDIPFDVVRHKMLPPDVELSYLGRVDKYSECGFISFDLHSEGALECIRRWAGMFASGACFGEKEWHDSYLFDVVRKEVEDDPHVKVNFQSLTMFPRRKGGSHPFVNSFLGEYLDHLKGDTRKRTGKPRDNDMVVDHASDYWRNK